MSHEFSRRKLLKTSAGALAISPLLSCGAPRLAVTGTSVAFLHGVASGDPYPDSVVLWTRVTPEEEGEISVEWQIAEDTSFRYPVAGGQAVTDRRIDYTIKIEATGLEPGRAYYYRFRAGQVYSPIGRTRTAHRGDVAYLRFAVMSCSSYAQGYFSAYRSVAARPDLHFVLHLGDYIYEYGRSEYGDVRDPEPLHEATTLEDYRLRHAQHKRDADLQEAHRQHPFIAIWDDHEIANDAWTNGAQNHDADAEGPFAERKAAALKAYFEWMPIRGAPDRRGFRAFRFGRLAELFVLDTRLWARQAPIDDITSDAANAADRELLGADQRRWLFDGLDASEAQFKLIGNQVLLSELLLLYNGDAWDGFPAERERFLSHVRDRELDNIVILTGDIHMSMAFELAMDPDDGQTYDPETSRGALAVELTTPAVTSPGLDGEFDVGEKLLQQLPHLKYAQLSKRGYLLVDLDNERLSAEYYHFDRVDDPHVDESFAQSLLVRDGTSHVELTRERAPARPDAAAPAPPA